MQEVSTHQRGQVNLNGKCSKKAFQPLIICQLRTRPHWSSIVSLKMHQTMHGTAPGKSYFKHLVCVCVCVIILNLSEYDILMKKIINMGAA